MDNILVIGAHGKVGRLIIKNLVSRGRHVRGMIRSDDQSALMLSLGAEIFIGDLEEDFSHAFEDMNCVIFTAGSGSHTGPDKTISVDQEGAIKSIDLALKYKIKKFIMVSAQGARDPENSERIRHYYRAKKIADDYLVKSGLNYTIFRPGRLHDDEKNREIRLSTSFIEKGITDRANLARSIADSIDNYELDKQIIEILDAE
jgi:uncharacterized protein YbjT (DUF2867 family)